ncbi:RAD9, HUS1, RAD1-interacting nuclear orphan protein 1 [Corythoichthys intestinalis]|uniref:RAD9, HUS1, RAD1-interacting nuclear orphan protein 1 n=1 Tax=Corythoichthys intestinalis TaxID=161448 RepID=UPI0025A510DF|nr:RAD9, HUS1, RAD1-interacting nuclear orphan protein 1 [Corythoichthys intestinalis]XP_057712306.1 RAD9, HUS1, RAD1-interacting nuclear orphan protein 1 [Corythoichthys intestinalis]XP_061809562.1 RAD9, HUS1, RAD1-interacting nuclear orphan protein 1-like [Nerophis lumbriciformis]
MPRKNSKTAKPSLLFVEPPLRSAKRPSGPEIRAALHPKVFLTKTQASSNLTSWVIPQFDTSLEGAVPRARRVRSTKCHLGTSIQDTCIQLSKKTTSKFPSLTFQSNGHQHPATKIHRSHAAGSEGILPKQKLDDSTKGASIPAPPKVDTPKITLEDERTPSSSPALRFLARPPTPPRCQPPDMLVPDTPEQHYGLKVTWRKRLWFMALLEERGQLMECHKFINSKS